MHQVIFIDTIKMFSNWLQSFRYVIAPHEFKEKKEMEINPLKK